MKPNSLGEKTSWWTIQQTAKPLRWAETRMAWICARGERDRVPVPVVREVRWSGRGGGERRGERRGKEASGGGGRGGIEDARHDAHVGDWVTNPPPTETPPTIVQCL
mmetsp:Transcript_9516/g.20485  ORF Transcript_9516/g.20485 Transcript_9516/m.20485 type:complete len:107 (-) Transcript_9516:385-705(-)